MGKIRVGLFFTDLDKVKENIESAKKLVSEGGDWDRQNRLKVYESIFCIVKRCVRNRRLSVCVRRGRVVADGIGVRSSGLSRRPPRPLGRRSARRRADAPSSLTTPRCVKLARVAPYTAAPPHPHNDDADDDRAAGT